MSTFFLFAVSPFVSLLVFACIAYLALFLVSLIIPFPMFNDENFGRGTLMALAGLFNLVMVVIPSVAASFLCCKLAQRHGLAGKWMLVSCALLGLFAAFYCFSVTSADSSGHYYLHDGIGLWSPMQLLHLIMPLAIGCWFFRRNSGDRAEDQLLHAT